MNEMKFLPNGTGILLSLVGLGAFASGIGLMTGPDGSKLGLSLELLEDSPFEDFMIPGIVLLVVIGIGSFFGAYLNFTTHRYAGLFTMALGLFLILWILAQAWWLGWINWLQPIFLLTGAAEMLLGYCVNDPYTPKKGKIWHFPRDLYDYWMYQ